MELPEIPTKRYIFCNRCGGETNHTCEGEHHRVYPDSRTIDLTSWRLWICAGCEEGTLEEYWASGVLDENGELLGWGDGLSDYCPRRTTSDLRAKHFTTLPPKLKSIYRETLLAFNNGMALLCAVGIRALIEGICAAKRIQGKYLVDKIDGLSSILPKNIIDGLHSIRFIGNEAAHELDAPENKELRLAIEICEDLLNYLYELDYRAQRLTFAQQAKRSSGRPA